MAKAIFSDLGVLFGDDCKQRYLGAWIFLEKINVLPQPRKTFECVEELAFDIADKGMMNPIVVARFSEESCRAYLAVINKLWGVDFRIEQLACIGEKGERIFYVLLAGERRYRSCRYLWEKGCARCQELYGVGGAGVCYKRHFGDSGKVEVRMCADIFPLAALFLQFSENTHMSVPAHEETRAYDQLFRLIKEAHPSFSLAEFARRAGRSPSTIRNALKFCELPVFVQEMVERREINYGIALELSRLATVGASNDDLMWWSLRARAENHNVATFRKLVSDHLNSLSAGQVSLFDVFDAEAERERKKNNIRHTVANEIIRELWIFIGYWQRVAKMCEEGQIGPVFSEKSPVRLLRKKSQLIRQKILPQLESSMPKSAAPEILSAFEDIEKTLNKLEENS